MVSSKIYRKLIFNKKNKEKKSFNRKKVKEVGVRGHIHQQVYKRIKIIDYKIKNPNKIYHSLSKIQKSKLDQHLV